jgi:hypothetical protein
MPECQHKNGCRETATFSASASMNGHTHARLLCSAHATDALEGDGMRFIDVLVQAEHGRSRRAAECDKMVRGDYRTRTRWVRWNCLRVAVAADAQLQLGDELHVRAELDERGYTGRARGVNAVVWGVAKLTRDIGKVRTAPTGHTYRFAYVQLPAEWTATFASVRVNAL